MQRDTLAVLTAACVAVGLLALGGFAALGSAGAQDTTNDAAADKVIHVSAVGDAEAEPDQAIVRVAITAEGDDIETVRDELASGSADLTAALDELGVDYESTDYNVDRWRHPREEREVPEYRGTHAFEITIEDPDQTGTAIDTAVDAGAEVGNVQLTLSEEERQALRDEAIEAAMEDARSQADTIAAAGDLEVVSVSEVDAAQRGYSPIGFDGAERVAEDDAAPPTSIESGDVSVSYSVDVTYNATSR
jgi:uncharacterized protein YggE